MTDPGWYPDPAGRAERRWWDGREWSDQVSTNGIVEPDPLPLAIRQPTVLEDGWRVTTLPPPAALQAIQAHLTSVGLTIDVMTDGTLSASKTVQKKPNWLLAIILLFLCLIPGIVYLVVANGQDRSSVTVTAQPYGTGAAVAVSGQGWLSVAPAQVAVKNLPY